jgi:hypothetical protein
MKRQVYASIALTVLISALAIGAEAQSRNRQLLTADIPFAFNAGSKTLPAGKYTFTVVNPSSDRNVLQVRSSDGHFSVLLQTTDMIGKSNANAKLMFRRYGDQYFLTQAWMAAERTGLTVLKSSAERQLQNEIVKAGKKSELVAVQAQ